MKRVLPLIALFLSLPGCLELPEIDGDSPILSDVIEDQEDQSDETDPSLEDDSTDDSGSSPDNGKWRIRKRRSVRSLATYKKITPEEKRVTQVTRKHLPQENQSEFEFNFDRPVSASGALCRLRVKRQLKVKTKTDTRFVIQRIWSLRLQSPKSSPSACKSYLKRQKKLLRRGSAEAHPLLAELYELEVLRLKQLPELTRLDLVKTAVGTKVNLP